MNGCILVITGMMICQPGDRIVETYVAGDKPKGMVISAAFLGEASQSHQAAWANLTDAKLEAAFADWGPRRHLPIDWSKVKGYKP